MLHARANRRLSALITACLALTALGLTSVAPVAAADQAVAGLTISPPLKEVVLGPGLVTAQAPITITSTANYPLHVTAQAVDFTSLDEYGGVTLENVGARQTKYSLAHWMQLPNGPDITIAPGKTATLPVIINNTSDLSPGGHYGAVVMTVAGDTGTGSNSVGLKRQLVSLIFVKKLGGDVYGLQLSSMQRDNHLGIPNEVTLRFKSTGNVHVVPRGYVEVTDPRGKQVAKGIIDQESTMILPGTTRQFVTILNPVDNSNASGRYKITAYYRYDGQEKFSTKTLYFQRGIGVTEEILLIVMLVCLFLCSIFWLVRKRRRQHKPSGSWRR